MHRLKSLLLTAAVLAGTAVAAEAQVITGSVTDAQTGVAVPAAQVFIAEINLGSLSEGNGSYTIENVPAGTHTVTVQRLGFRQIEQAVTVAGGQTVQVDFELETEALSLDAVVVTGTAGGSQVRAIGNLVERVGVPDIATEAPVQTVEDVLTGRIPGVMLLGQPNSAGDGAQIRIRGNSSIGIPGDPIVYVDGVRMVGDRGFVQRYSAASRLNDINPADIESIEVIKGPAAATLYGTEAANGVIQIITKRGQVGAPVFDFTAETGALYMPDHMITRGWIPDPSRCASVPCNSVDELLNTNLVEINAERCGRAPYEHCDPVLFIHGLTQRYNAAVRGGTDLLRYSASISRTDQDGVVRWNYDERNTVRASIQVTASESLNFTLNGAYVMSERAPPQSFWGGNFAWGGRLNTVFNDHPDRGFQTPPEAWYSDRRIELFTNRRSTWSLEVRHDATEWLNHRLVFGIDQIHERFDELDKRQGPSYRFFGSDGKFGQKDVRAREVPVSTFDFSGTATFRFMDGLLGSATSYGAQYYHEEDLQYRATGEEFAVAALSTVGAAARETAHESFVENTTLGFYIQNQFDWDNRLFVTLAVRRDDNSAFGADFGGATYPKISGTWVIHEEGFWDIDWISQFRARTAWGAAGQQPDAFAATRLFTPDTGPGAAPVIRPRGRSFGNPNLGPERGEELELGFDAEFFDGRIAANFTWFNRVTKDAIVSKTVPPSIWPSQAGDFAGGLQLVNIGEVKAWGTETYLNVLAFQSDPLAWDIGVSFTTLANEILDMGGIERIQVGRTMAHYEGFGISALSDKRVVHAEFVNGVNGQVENVMCDAGTGNPGPYSQAELAELGWGGLEPGGEMMPCANAPRVVWGRTEPTWLLNVTNTLTIFDDWRITAMVDALGGHWQGSDYLGARSTSYPTSQLVYLQDNAIGQAYRQVTRNGLSFHRAGIAKLRELSLSYTLPESVVDRVGASRASVTVGGRNLWRIWFQQQRAGDWCEGVDGRSYGPDRCEIVTDPEMSRPGYDFGNESGGDWPPLSSYSLRLNVTF